MKSRLIDRLYNRLEKLTHVSSKGRVLRSAVQSNIFYV